MLKKLITVSCFMLTFLALTGNAVALTCEKGYVIYNGRCVKQLKCKNGGKQNGTRCACKAGWTGNLCQTAKKCPYKDTKCSKGYYATGNKCKTGNKMVVECKANACTGYKYTKCPTGYTKSATCQSGKTKKLKCGKCASGYIKYNGKCIKQLKCKNGGKQSGTKCACKAGWTGNLCQTVRKCAYTTTKCNTGYVKTGNTCQSGNKKYIECKANPCTGYGYTKCPTGSTATASCLSGKTKKLKCACPNGQIISGGKCIKKLNCQNGGVQNGTACKCPAGWIGNLCQTAEGCPYDTTVCVDGYEETGETCEFRGIIYKKCRVKSCEGYRESCNAGYHAILDNTCLSGDKIMYKCAENDCTGYDYTTCSDGYVEVDSCRTGNTIKLKCEENDCTGYVSACSEGQKPTGRTCKSGRVTLIECRDAGCEDYPLNSQPASSTCRTYSTCPSNPSKYRCDKCQIGYGKDSTGNCVKGQNALVAQTNDKNNAIKSVTNNDFRNVFGLTNETGNEHYNAYNYNGAELDITNNSDGNVYGVHADPSYAHNAYATSTNVSNGLIEINNKGNGGIYGIYGVEGAANAQTKSGNAQGDIEIENEGHGNIYGIHTESTEFSEGQVVLDVLTKNAESVGGTALGSIIIKNMGNGNIIGMDAGSTGINALSNSSGASVGTININNMGDGEIRGINAEYLAQNSTSIKAENEAEVIIRNMGEGNVWGIYSNGYAHNAASYTNAETYGLISIVNRGNGDVAAMTSADIRNSDAFNTNSDTYYYFKDVASYHLYNARANAGTATAVIDIQNEGDGDITVFDTIISNTQTFGNYTGNITYNTYAINNGTARSDVKIKNESFGGSDKTIALSKDTLNLAYAENKGNIINNVDIENYSDKKIVLSKYNGISRAYITAKDNSTATNNIKIKNVGNGNINLPFNITAEQQSIVRNTLDIDSEGKGRIVAYFEATTSNNKEISSEISVKNNSGDDLSSGIAVRNYTGSDSQKVVNKVAVDDTGNGNVTIEILSNAANGDGKTVDNEVSVRKSGNGTVLLSHSQDYAKASDGGMATSKINLDLSGNNTLNWQSSSVLLASASGSSKSSTATSELNIVRNNHSNEVVLPSFSIIADELGEVDNEININNNNSGALSLPSFSISTGGLGEVDNKINIISKNSGDLDLSLDVSGEGKTSNLVTISNIGDNNINIDFMEGYEVQYLLNYSQLLKNDFGITNEGDGNIEVDISAADTTINSKGDGKITAGGHIGTLDVTSEGNGDVEIFGDSKVITLNKSGGGNVTVSGSGSSADITVEGDGDIEVSGSNRVVTLNRTGDGNITIRGSYSPNYITAKGNGNIEVWGGNKAVTLDNEGNGSITIVNNSNGSVSLTNVSDLNEVGGDVSVTGNNMAVELTNTGNNNITVSGDNDTGKEFSVDITNTGDGNITLSGNKVITLNNKGNGNITAGGYGGTLYLTAEGEGDVAVSGDSKTVILSHTGDGDIEISGDNYTGNELTVDIINTGNGDVDLSGNNKTVTLNNIGNGNITTDLNYGTANITAGGNGNIEIYGTNNYFIVNNGKNITDRTSDAVLRIINKGNNDITKYNSSQDAIISNYGSGIVRHMAETGNIVRGEMSVINNGSGHVLGGTSIINKSTGSAYGLFYTGSKNVYYSEDIEIANIGNSIVYGLYAGGGSVNNSSEIKIHNLGNGTSIGIYVKENASLNNTGNITIDRENYTIRELEDDGSLIEKTYSASTAIGGKAIGIYGGVGSEIINSGNIVINSAENALGIFSLGSNVTNTGEILIDGEYTENAVRLNGNTLFQNGTVIVGGHYVDRTLISGAEWESGTSVKTDSLIGSVSNEEVSLNNTFYRDVYGRKNRNNNNPIHIVNTANVDVYGVYEASNYSNISIENTGNGNIYGIYKGSNGKDKNVEITNTGDGLAVGMYDSSGSPSNYGDITIHNLGNGVAIGIYADEKTTATIATNYGNIIIDRGNLTSKGGKAIGIYAAKGADAINKGTIIINGAEDAYGIWSESRWVTNTGIILIDGEYTENAIRLNGGKLLQDGVLIIGADWSNNGSAAPTCDIYEHLQNGQCVANDGYVKIDGVYQRIGLLNGSENNSDIIIENTDNLNIYGMYGGQSFNAYSESGTVNALINITDTGDGNIYGIYGSTIHNSYENTAVSNGTISITGYGNGNIYGIYNKSMDDRIYNAHDGTTKSSGIATGIISITDTGNGDVYGMYNNGLVSYNAYSFSGTATGAININNGGSGNVYGMYNVYGTDTSGRATNAYGNSSTTTTGTISIINSGDDNAYGMYSNGDVTNSDGNSSGTTTGEVNIINSGNGDAYGMYGSQGINAVSYNSLTGGVVATIGITNIGSGDAYGMYGTNRSYRIHNAHTNSSSGSVSGTINIINAGIGNSYGMYGYGSVYNQSATGVTSLIEMVNAGDGLAVGIYAKNGSINNSGDIKIHNLGDGVAVGIYADGSTYVSNSGNITIDRESYKTYSAETEVGGQAIGIYGAADSYIDNAGVITINGASEAYGIWSEGGGLYNTGTIKINGAECYGDECLGVANAIRLNRGKLFQDGVLEVHGSFADMECSTGSVKFGDSCYKIIDCGEGGTQFENTCICEENYVLSGGETDKGSPRCYADLHCENNHATQYGNECYCNDGYVEVDGVCQHLAYNGYSSVDNISIENHDDLDVYGRYNYGSGLTNTKAISINNYGDGNVYGIYNADTKGNSTVNNSTIQISNQGNGDVYGMYGRSLRNYSKGDIEATINISNIGNGNVYGMYVYGEDSGDGSYTQGTINIWNQGNGNVYGMHGEGMYDAKGTGLYNNFYSSSKAEINIVNNGSGNAYGMQGIDIGNGQDTYKNAIIRMINRGNGLAVGMHSVWSIINYGDIEIHNLGEGTAVGMYIDSTMYLVGTPEAHNYGTITINRETYSDDKGTYSAETEVGGMAIGIYGVADTSIYNEETGVITINGAENAYGIYSEGGNVTNNGTININGVSCTGSDCTSANNAIVLNGGKFFQNGVLTRRPLVGEGVCPSGTIRFDDYCYTDLHCEAKHAVQNRDVCICNDEYMMVEGMCRLVGSSETTNNGVVMVENDDDLDVYGMYNSSGDTIYNAYKYNANSPAASTINIINNGNGNTYGMYASGDVYNASSFDTTSGMISITAAGNGNAYGMYSGVAVHNASNSSAGTTTGEVIITNIGNSDAYGMYSNLVNYNALNVSDFGATIGKISINNIGDGNVYGMYSLSDNYNVYNAYSGTATGTISIINRGSGDAYGMYGVTNNNATKYYNSDTPAGISTGTINMINTGSGNAYGMYGKYNNNENNTNTTSLIEMANTGNGLVVGMYNLDGHMASTAIYYDMTNSGDITIHNLANGTAIGMYADGQTYALNSGNITINRESYIMNVETYSAETAIGGTAIGIYGASGSSITNRGTITINGAENTYGIYSEGGDVINYGVITINGTENAYGIYSEGGSLGNKGTININGVSCTGSDCTSANNAIVLNGGKLFQDGVMTVSSGANLQSAVAPKLLSNNVSSATDETTNDIQTTEPENNVAVTPVAENSIQVTPARQAASLNLNDFGGTVIASGTSKFIVEGAISGDLAINNNVVENGFETVYSVNGMIDAADTSGLNLISQSALFDATLENNTDAVMTMKAFNAVVKSGSIAEFLQNNYAEGNNEKLFTTLKSAETVTQLNSTIDDLFGKSMFSRMAFEDLTMLREVNFDMNRQLFNQEEGYFALSGYVSPSQYDGNLGSQGRYSLNGYNNGKHSFAVGVAISDVSTNDGHNNNSRFDRSFMMSTPVGYKTRGFEFIITPKVGYADGHYDRDGFNNMTYEGKIQKRMVALMNEARYPFEFGGLKLVPSAEFNMIGYNIKGHEDEKEYSLRIKSQNHYSVEAGFGLMAEKEFMPFKDNKLSIKGGVAVYHEFANPYELSVAMNGMSGTYRLRDEKRSDNRAVVRFGFGYELGNDIDVSANLLTNIDREYRTEAGIDLKYHF